MKMQLRLLLSATALVLARGGQAAECGSRYCDEIRRVHGRNPADEVGPGGRVRGQPYNRNWVITVQGRKVSFSTDKPWRCAQNYVHALDNILQQCIGHKVHQGWWDYDGEHYDISGVGACSD